MGATTSELRRLSRSCESEKALRYQSSVYPAMGIVGKTDSPNENTMMVSTGPYRNANTSTTYAPRSQDEVRRLRG